MKRSLLACQWILREVDQAVCDLFVREIGISPLSASLLYHRGIRSAEEAERFLNLSLSNMHSPFLFKDMERAVERIVRAMLRNERILIYGDYDADGVTGVAILLNFFRQCGLDPQYYIPHRILEGYGLNPEAIARFGTQGTDLLITVDCGSAADEAIRIAREWGIEVIVTDHHECPSSPPQALAVLNPKRSDSGFPFSSIAGVGVAFYLLVALRVRLRELGYWEQHKEPNLLRYLDLVALGTIADMVPLQKDSRIFAKFGMDEIAVGRRPGIFALKEVAGVLERPVDTRSILFRLGPRINAAGRIGWASESVELLTCEDIGTAREIAQVLEGRNRERKAIEEVVYLEAKPLAATQIQEHGAKALVLASKNWHRGILGIVASRIANDFSRPTIMISLEEEQGKGSARGVGEILLLDALDSCKDWLEGYGGHQGAAGVAIRIENIEPFRRAFENAVQRQMGGQKEILPTLHLDLCLNSPEELTENIVAEFELFAPFGYGNTEPVVALHNMRILGKRLVGENHLKLSVSGDRIYFDAIGFGMASLDPLLGTRTRWDLAVTPYLDSWGGHPQIQLRLVDIRPA